ncbi:MAG: hypothetical protein ACJ8A0_09865, partial [Microvirga sp.]
TEGRSAETLSQASFVKALLPYISDNPLLDRDIGKRRGFWPKSQTFDRERLIFRDFFLAQEDEKIALNVWNYFDAVRQKWPAAWRDIEAGYILNRTNGFLALMRFLRPAFIALNGFGKVLPMQAYLTLFGPSVYATWILIEKGICPDPAAKLRFIRTLWKEAEPLRVCAGKLE